MLFNVGLSHVIATSAAHVQVSFQQIQLGLCSQCPPLGLMHAQILVKVICFSQDSVAAFYMWRFFRILYTKITKISSLFTELFKKSRCHCFFLKDSVHRCHSIAYAAHFFSPKNVIGHILNKSTVICKFALLSESHLSTFMCHFVRCCHNINKHPKWVAIIPSGRITIWAACRALPSLPCIDDLPDW